MNRKKILEWYCREGYCGSWPDCDKHCPGPRGENPCFNYRILAQQLGIRKDVWIVTHDAKPRSKPKGRR
jgi:hypothetical protein